MAADLNERVKRRLTRIAMLARVLLRALKAADGVALLNILDVLAEQRDRLREDLDDLGQRRH